MSIIALYPKDKNMKQIILMRHADHKNNVLTQEGKRDSAQAAGLLSDQNIIPDVILTSPIKRAQETAAIMQNVFNARSGKNIPVVAHDPLALGILTSAKDAFSTVDGKADKVLVVSHQPNIRFIAEDLGHEVDAEKSQVSVFEITRSFTDPGAARLVFQKAPEKQAEKKRGLFGMFRK